MKSKSLRSYLLAGLVVWLPILVTFVILRFIIDLLDQTIALLPNAYQPEHALGIHIPGLGVLLSLTLLVITGVIVTNFLGQRIVRRSEKLLERIPFVRPIYGAAKQVINALFATNSDAFRKVLLVEYPRKGLWAVAFQTGGTYEEFNTHTGKDMISIFIPTTPNPTSGFLMVVPKEEVVELKMSVEEALKFIISLGVMQPSPSVVLETQ